MFSGIKCAGLRICWASLRPGARGFVVWWMAMAAAAWLGTAALQAQVGAVCQGSNITYGAGGNDGTNPALCAGSNVVCQQPVVTSGPTYAKCEPPGLKCLKQLPQALKDFVQWLADHPPGQLEGRPVTPGLPPFPIWAVP